MIISAQEAKIKTVKAQEQKEVLSLVNNAIQVATKEASHEVSVGVSNFSEDAIGFAMDEVASKGYEVTLELHELAGLFTFPGNLIVSWK